MMKLLWVLFLCVVAAGCGDYGYHPNYIISHDQEQPLEAPQSSSF